MTKVSDGQIQTTKLDHLGLVAVICQDLKIAQKIDDRLPCNSQRKVSPGRAVVAMILNEPIHKVGNCRIIIFRRFYFF
jgi:hypothetical protein